MTTPPLPALYQSDRWRTAIPVGLAIFLLALAGGLIAHKFLVRGYRLVPLDPEESWKVRLVMDVEGAGQKVVVRAMNPEPVSSRQGILDEQTFGEGFAMEREGPFTVWKADELKGKARLVLQYRARTEARKYSLPSRLEWEDLEKGPYAEWLKADELVQSEHPDIRAKAEVLAAGSDDVIGFVRALFAYVHDRVSYREVGGPTDSLTALKLEEASCNGKNRLLVALARSRGVPARLAKGIVLEKGVVKTESHAWSELLLNGQWVPFCPTAGHFAEIPAKYLEYPKTDERMFRYSRNLRFEHRFEINHGARTPAEALRQDLDNPDHILRAWGSLDQAQFSLPLLMIILTVPIGATMVAFLRNVVGLVPFGTFLPALIAVSFRETGFLWGATMFTVVILLGSGVNKVLRAFRLLHFPRLGILMTFTVACVLGLALLAMRFDLVRAAKIGMFPLAVLTLTTERFVMTEEQGTWLEAFRRFAISMVAGGACYLVMDDFRVQSAVLVFPELLLVVVSVNLFIGVYTGLRWTEYARFRLLGRPPEAAA